MRIVLKADPTPSGQSEVADAPQCRVSSRNGEVKFDIKPAHGGKGITDATHMQRLVFCRGSAHPVRNSGIHRPRKNQTVVPGDPQMHRTAALGRQQRGHSYSGQWNVRLVDIPQVSIALLSLPLTKSKRRPRIEAAPSITGPNARLRASRGRRTTPVVPVYTTRCPGGAGASYALHPLRSRRRVGAVTCDSKRKVWPACRGACLKNKRRRVGDFA